MTPGFKSESDVIIWIDLTWSYDPRVFRFATEFNLLGLYVRCLPNLLLKGGIDGWLSWCSEFGEIHVFRGLTHSVYHGLWS